MLARAASWLTPNGRLIADLDLSAIDLGDDPAATRRLAARLRAAGFAYSSRRHQVTCAGRRDIRDRPPRVRSRSSTRSLS